MSDVLRVVPFTPDMLDPVRGFDYGEEPYQKELADWLLNEAVAALRRGTKVWLYLNQVGEFVGYGSLGVTRLRLAPDGTRHRSGRRPSQGVLAEAGRAVGGALLLANHAPPVERGGCLARRPARGQPVRSPR